MMKFNLKQKKTQERSFLQSGLTMIELLIVLAILGIFAILFLLSMTGQTSKGRDAKRKDDLKKIQIAFEDYYNDNDCYPDGDVLDECFSTTALEPYLREIPCDPLTDEPYVYEGLAADQCSGYRVLVQLENENDPAIAKLGCTTAGGCNYSDTSYNYGISSGANVSDGTAGWTGIGSGTQVWVCGQEVGGPQCQNIESSEAAGCTFYWEDAGDCVEAPAPAGNCYEGSPTVCLVD